MVGDADTAHFSDEVSVLLLLVNVVGVVVDDADAAFVAISSAV